MIFFEELTYKNLQAVGNQPIVIDLTREQNTLISGHNGSGKTTIIIGLCYALFGKPYKNVKLAQLINTNNGGRMVCDIKFRKGEDQFKVIRGEKPKVFEIYKNDTLIDQTGNSRNYQAKLERILGMDYRMFTQTVVLNRSRYVPFMTLTPADRRKIVEDILDISVFSYMAKANKAEVSTVKSAISGLGYDMTNMRTTIEGQERMLETVQKGQDTVIDNYKAELISVLNELKGVKNDIVEETDVRNGMSVDTTDHSVTERTLNKATSLIEVKKGSAKKEIKFLTDNTDCPTCNQPIDDAFRDSVLSRLTNDIDALDAKAALLSPKIDAVTEAKQVQADQNLEVVKQDGTITMLRTRERELTKRVADLKKKLEVAQADTSGTVTRLTDELNGMNESLKDLLDRDAVQQTKMNELTVIDNMLKDGGVKADIIDEYIPFINQKINEYLREMGFSVSFVLDKEFNEKFMAPNREGFTYFSLSDGQRARVDLAILMAWLDVSSRRNSVVCNLLILDELLENMDTEGVELFTTMIKTKLSKKNVFVVSQRYDLLKDYFRGDLQFKLDSGFTVKV